MRLNKQPEDRHDSFACMTHQGYRFVFEEIAGENTIDSDTYPARLSRSASLTTLWKESAILFLNSAFCLQIPFSLRP